MEEDITKNRLSVYLFVAAGIMYSLVQVVNWQFKVVSPSLLGAVEIASVAAMLFFGSRFCKEFEFENQYFKVIFFLFFMYGVSLMVRGFPTSYPIFKYNLQADFVLWPYIIPLMVFMNKEDLTFFYLIKCFFILGCIFLVLSIVDPFLVTQRITAEPYIHAFAFTCGFLFLNTIYFKNKVSWVAFTSLVLSVVAFTLLARRNAIVSYGALLMLGFYFLMTNLGAAKIVRIFPLLAAALIAGLLSSDELLPKLTGKLNERMGEDTRSDVFDNLFKSMEDDMIIGKGMNGKYYSPIGEMLTDDGVTYDEVQNRDVIENGYLQLLLNGGYVYIALFVLTLLPAALLGIFKSENQLSRACGLIILLWMIDMSIYGMPRLVMQYILVWIAAGICYKASFREKTDEEILENFEAVGLA